MNTSTNAQGLAWSESVRIKFLILFALGAILIVAASLYSFYSARNGLNEIKRVNDTLVAQGIATQDAVIDFKEQVQEWKNTLLRGSDPKLLDRYWSAFLAKEDSVSRSAKKLEQTVEIPKAKELLAGFLAAHREMGQKYRSGLDEFKKAGFDPKVGDLAVRGIDRAPTERLEEVSKIVRNEATQAVASVQSDASRNLLWSFIAMGATLVVVSILASLTVRSLLRQLGGEPVYAAAVVERIASGDLTVEVETRANDSASLLAYMKQMRGQLHATVGQIKGAADAVGTAAREIAEAHGDLSSRTEEQASSLEETAASMEEMSATVSQNAENARKANQLANGASDIAVRGGQAVREVVGTMNAITESSKKISDIIGVIDGIAFQTNILALNAAVEAARAGEQGRGFAVVASEVRNLAQRSAGAAKEIKGLIGDSVAKVEAGSRQVEAAGKTVEEIVNSVKSVTVLIGEISAASQEQSQSIEQVSDAMQQLEKVTQQNAAMVEEATAASGSLEEQAKALAAAVGNFKLDDRAAAHAVQQHAVAHPRSARKPDAAKAALPPKRASVAAALDAPKKRAPGGKGNAGGQDWEEF